MFKGEKGQAAFNKTRKHEVYNPATSAHFGLDVRNETEDNPIP